jgi:hypothetical protein
MRKRLPRVARMRRDDNQLRRRVDKVEAAIMTGLVVAFLIAAPLLAIVSGRLADAAALREQRAERGWRQVPAVLLQSAGAGQIDLDGDWDSSWVTARWALPGHAPRTGLIAVELNAQAGQRVPVWVTPAGKLTHQPLTGAEVRDQIAFAVMLAVVSLAGVLSLAAVAVRVTANRRRMIGWTRAWESTGPRWSTLR